MFWISKISSNLTKIQTSRGATLVEVMVAILLLSLTLSPILYGAISALNVATSIRDNFIAAHLAAEGVEVIRAIRDANWFANPPRPFNTGLGDGSWRVQWDSTSLLAPDLSAFLLKGNGGVYSYVAGGTQTLFKRSITITNISATQIQIISDVTWTERGISKSISAESQLFDWSN